MNKYIMIFISAILITGCVDRKGQQQAEETKKIVTDPSVAVTFGVSTTRLMTEKLEITGQIVSAESVQLGARISGRLTAVFVKDGDSVKAGQVIAQQDTSILSSQVSQALASVNAASAQLAQARANASITPEKTKSAVAAAESQLRSAKAQLAKARKGAREEDVKQAEWGVRSAKANLDSAEKEMNRTQKLFADGAISQQRVEQAENAYQQALAGYNRALEIERTVRSATRPEDLSSAEEAVRQAEENLRNAKAQKALDVVLDQQVMSAKAALDAAQAQLTIARQGLADATIRAPFSGRISGKPVQAGAVLNPGQPVATLIGAEGLYFEGEVPENRVSEVQFGKTVIVKLDALNSVSFNGTVVAINPLGSDIGRNFKVRVQFSQDSPQIRAGMFARGEVIIREAQDAVVVPNSALVSRDGKLYVFTVSGDTAKRITVTSGLLDSDFTQVFGLERGVKIVLKGASGLVDGSQVKELTDDKESAPVGK